MIDRVKFQPDVDAEAEARKQGVDFNRVEGHSAINASDFIRMCQLLGISSIERDVPKIQEKISFLADWADSHGANGDELERRRIVKNLWDELGVTYRGEDLVTYLYRYAKLDQEEKSIQTEKSLFKPNEKNIEEKEENQYADDTMSLAELEKDEQTKPEPTKPLSAIEEARRIFEQSMG